LKEEEGDNDGEDKETVGDEADDDEEEDEQSKNLSSRMVCKIFTQIRRLIRFSTFLVSI
jgi:hypothetical protein